jgi:hypothetical protein
MGGGDISKGAMKARRLVDACLCERGRILITCMLQLVVACNGGSASRGHT